MRRALDWVFRSRETGQIVVGQKPNALLILFVVSWGTTWLVTPAEPIGHGVFVASRVLLGLWALDELLRGVNPWRRTLGFAVLTYVIWTALN